MLWWLIAVVTVLAGLVLWLALTMLDTKVAGTTPVGAGRPGAVVLPILDEMGQVPYLAGRLLTGEGQNPEQKS